MKIDLNGRRALVTGGSAGLGQASARMLALAGADVAVVARREGLLKESADLIAQESGRRIVPVAADVTDARACRSAVEAAETELGGIDILVNCAGGSRTLPLDATEEDWRESFEINFWPALRITHLLLPGMLERGFGRIMTVTGSSEPKLMPLYKDLSKSSFLNAATPAKTAVHAWSKGLSREVGGSGVTVNCIPPGRIVTEQTRRRYPDEAERNRYAKERIPIGRFGNVEEFASLVTYLASDLGGYITGELIHVDGGMRAFAF